MKWTPMRDEGGYRRLDVQAKWDEVSEEYEDLLSRYTASVGLPGFRPGKAPSRAIEQRYRAEILADFSAKVVQRLGWEAVRESGVEALGPPEASEIDCGRGKPFRAVVRFLPMPEFGVPELDELAIDEDGADPKDGISRRLLDLVPLQLPLEIVRRELRVDGLDDSPPGSEAWTAASERIRLMLILKRIARQEGIEVDEEDVRQRIDQKAIEFGSRPEALRADLERGGGTPRLRDMLLAERTLDYLSEMSRGQNGPSGERGLP